MLLLLFLGNSSGNYAAQAKQKSAHAPAGTRQKMIVDNGSVTMELDVNRLNGITSGAGKPTTLHFAAAANSFFSILVVNDLLRGPEQGSISLILQGSVPPLPVLLGASINQLTVERLPLGSGFDLAVRDGKSGFTFFNIEAAQYDYDARARLLSITGARLLVSKQFAESLGRPSDAGAVAGQISIGASMQAIEIDRLDANGNVTSTTLPAIPLPGTVPGPDVIIGELIGLVQSQSGSVNGRVGLALGTDACNKGTENVDWFALPSNDHPFIPQNVYRMSGGADNTQRFEQIGQSWGKHAFTAASSNTCGFGCNGVGGSHLGSGCSDAYGPGLNGSQTGIGSRAWVNPFTGVFPSGTTANDHSGHAHDVTSHRILVDVNDLNTSLNPGATYFAEAEYIVPHEYAWCQSHPGQCNMYNNASYQRYTVTGINQPFSFSPAGATMREQPAIRAWTGATVTQLEPAPGADGIWFMGFKVTNPSAGVWHYEYALYNQNLDRAIQSFSVPIGPGVNVSNIGFHAPIQQPGWAHDGTVGDAGYSSMPWTVNQTSSSITWNSETFAQNQNANAIRYGTLYNFRFDADQPPNPTNATVGFFKTGGPMAVLVQAPGGVPTPSPTPTPTASPTASPTATATPTATPTVTPSCPPVFSENFDSVTPPALPPNWMATQGVNGGGFPFWVTSNSGSPAPPADSLPNAVFSVDPNNLLDNRLDTPTLTYSAGAQLSFRQNYDIEQSSATVAFDAGVLEISVNGGAYQDIITAGGSFVTGGYNHTSISTAFMNPCLPSRPNWSGISNGGSGGFQTTTLNLPAAGAGQPVKLRWRMCSDNSVSHAGWRVDNVSVNFCGGPSPTPTATATATATPSATATATPTATSTATPTATSTATATATATPRPTPTPRSSPSPGARPTPAPRP
jgi:hypothetical protein